MTSGVEDAGRQPWLVRHPAEWRQIAIVGVYWGVLAAMVFVPWCRNPAFLALGCALSFLNAVVIHNHMHRGIFHSKALNLWWRRVLSFGNLYPASANIPAHNLVHHHFEDDGKPDWADSRIVGFRWNLLNLLHFPNVAGPRTFNGVTRWGKSTRQPGFERQYQSEMAFAFGLTGLLLVVDFWTTLFFVVVPQLYGARCILRINILQHDRADVDSEWNHSRNFVGRAFNYVMCNNGYHTIHHNRAGLHWSELARAHTEQVRPRIDPKLDEKSMALYLLRTYLFAFRRPNTFDGRSLEAALDAALPGAALCGGASGITLPSREERRKAAAADAMAEVRG